ncbi:MAG: terpene cyclase/mutase family protein [Planctomycetaceae bacterium]|nr:terpene cyclase/mutase family protein [Planctomycetaceae bacterium]
MESGRRESRLPDLAEHSTAGESRQLPFEAPIDNSPLGQTISRCAEWLRERQHPDGHWVAELQGDTILESEYILLLTFLGEEESPVVHQAARYILEQQADHGGWSLYPGGPLDISVSVKAYWALKIVGHAPESEPMRRARQAILQAGGAEQVNSFTRYYMALLGLISYRQCPAVPPELIMLPRWTRLSIDQMSAWSRTILVPLSLVWAYQPSRVLDEAKQIPELFRRSPSQLSVCNNLSGKVDELSKPTSFPWAWFFRQVDYGIKLFEACRLTPFRKRAIRLSASWMLERFEQSDGLGAIFPPMVWSLIALRCLDFEDDSPDVVRTRKCLDDLILRELANDGEETVRLQPCVSPVWDTAIATLALAETWQEDCKELVRHGADWLRAREVRFAGDWSLGRSQIEPSGWCFEYNNAFYPDVDDTAMVLMALSRSLPEDLNSDWLAELVPQGEPARRNRLATIVSGSSNQLRSAMQDMSRLQPTLDAFRRGVQWLLAMQSKNGGWGAFDADNDFELLTRVPFADHNAMIDPPTPDITARVLEALAMLGVNPQHESIQRAVAYLWTQQLEDGSWPGRWGVNYLYGTWQVLAGLMAVGISREDSRVQRAVNWLKSRQQSNGGWGETPATYDRPELSGTGTVTASQTAWALLGLISAGEAGSAAVTDGIAYLIQSQTSDGEWLEPEFTGTGFPRVFYLRYDYYRIYFPLLALGRYRQAINPQTHFSSGPMS